MFKMLVVDDENLIRYSLTMTFKGTNISVRTAETGREALQAIHEERFDVCFLDLHLPDMGGVEVLRTLSSVAPETKVIVMSGDLMEQETRDIVRKHAVLFMEKPFDLDYAKYIANLIIRRLDSQSSGVSLPDFHLPADQERRRCIRHESGKVVMCSAMASAGDTNAVNIEATLKDISASGMGLVTTQPVKPGSVLTLFDGESINLGVVRWMASAQPQGRYQIGVQFSVH
jgi:CheY-like chemotaxis protein